jgi:hypothetical protein
MARTSDRSHVIRPRKIYGNNAVFSPDGILMFRCSDRRLNFYQKEGLITEYTPPPTYNVHIEDGESGFKLLFEPNGPGRSALTDGYYLEKRIDQCVVCGFSWPVELINPDSDMPPPPSAIRDKDLQSENGLTSHHVVPQCYRKLFPLDYKDYQAHDVLLVCHACHGEYNKSGDARMKELAKELGAPYDGTLLAVKTARFLLKVRKEGDACKVPADNIRQAESRFRQLCSIPDEDEISEEVLLAALVRKHHAQMAVETLGPEGIPEFVRGWRQHFLDVMKPRFLSKLWSVDSPVSLSERDVNREMMEERLRLSALE